MEDAQLALQELTPKLGHSYLSSGNDMRIIIDIAKTVALPPPAHAPTKVEITLLASIGGRVAGPAGAMVVWVLGWVRYFR